MRRFEQILDTYFPNIKQDSVPEERPHLKDYTARELAAIALSLDKLYPNEMPNSVIQTYLKEMYRYGFEALNAKLIEVGEDPKDRIHT